MTQAHATKTIQVTIEADLVAQADLLARRFGFRDLSQALEVMLRDFVAANRPPQHLGPAPTKTSADDRLFGLTGTELDAITERGFAEAALSHHVNGRPIAGLVAGQVEWIAAP